MLSVDMSNDSVGVASRQYNANGVYPDCNATDQYVLYV